MSKVKEIRESADVKLTKLAARADAFQATLEKSRDHADRIQPNQQEVRRALDQLKVGVDRHKDLSDGRKQAIHSLVDTLNAQIAASATASRETLAYARQQIHQAGRRLETELDGALAESKERVDDCCKPRSTPMAGRWTNSMQSLRPRNYALDLSGTTRIPRWTMGGERWRKRPPR